MGCPLIVDGEVLGALMFDALDPRAFDHVELHVVDLIATMAAAAIRTSALASALELLPNRPGQVVREALDRMGGELLGESDALAQVRHDIDLLGRSQLTALITGETGTGKELVARAIHAQSGRARDGRSWPSTAPRCPTTLLESELFGHVRGAFTGADRRAQRACSRSPTAARCSSTRSASCRWRCRPSCCACCRSGEVQRVGARPSRSASTCASIAATNRDLPTRSRAGRFRADLYYRLDVVPAARAAAARAPRGHPAARRHFLDSRSARLGAAAAGSRRAARKLRSSYRWPGNVRELEHTLMRGALRASARARGETVLVETGDLGLQGTRPLPARAPRSEQPRLREAVNEFTKHIITTTVTDCDGNWAEAARRLGFNAATCTASRTACACTSGPDPFARARPMHCGCVCSSP